MSILKELRKEQMSAGKPKQHVFRITRKQEREIVEQVQLLGFKSNEIEHIATLYGCRVELLD